MLIRYFLIFFINLYSLNAYSAEYLTEQDSKCNITNLIIKGEITSNEFEIFKGVIENIKKRRSESGCGTLWIELNSEGGDVFESIKIGRLIRENLYITSVSDRAKCYSSCIFIYAAGVTKYAFLRPWKDFISKFPEFANEEDTSPKIGIHRPYFSNLKDGLSVRDIRLLREKNNLILYDYLKEMDVSTALLDAMMAIPPTEIKLLTGEELTAYRLFGEDANIEEQYVAKQAAILQISTSEYRKRSALSTSKCSKTFDDSSYLCAQSIMWNISIEAYKRKYFRIKNCSKIHEKNQSNEIKCIQNIIKEP